MVETRQRKQKEAGNRVFATVGTTRFDQLINALDSRVSHTPMRMQPAVLRCSCRNAQRAGMTIGLAAGCPRGAVEAGLQ